MSKVTIDSPQDILYMITWEYDTSMIGPQRTKTSRWVEEVMVTKSNDVWNTTYKQLMGVAHPLVSFRNVRRFVMEAVEILP